MNLDDLVPFKGKHAIKEAIINFSLTNPIVQPKELKDLMKRDSFDFQKFETLQQQGFRLSVGGETQISSQKMSSKDIGFRFYKYGENEQVTGVLAGETHEETGRSNLSFHHLDYIGWQSFLSDTRKYIQEVTSLRNDFSMVAFSLHYIDEFLWRGDEAVPIEEIFDKTSNFLPPIFFESSNSAYLITTQKEVNSYTYYERLEVGVDNNRPEPLITISHSVTQPLSKAVGLSEFIADDKQISMVDTAHAYNKSMLQSVLTNKVCKKIHMTN